MMRVDSKLLLAAVCALLGCGGLACSGAGAASSQEQDEVPAAVSTTTEAQRSRVALADDGASTNDESDDAVVRFHVRLDPKPCEDGEGTCGGIYVRAEGATEETYVEGASFVEGTNAFARRYTYLTTDGVVIGTLCRGRLHRLPRTEGGVVIGTLVGAVTGARVVVDGAGNVIGTFTNDAAGNDQTIRIRSVVASGTTAK
jgi:hypothetical protein